MEKVIQKSIDLYLDWLCNFLTVSRFAEYYNIDIKQAEKIIKTGRKLHERQFYQSPRFNGDYIPLSN